MSNAGGSGAGLGDGLGRAIELNAVARRFGRRWPLRRVSLVVDAGEVVALTGRNGSGKTTLLRILATALRPTYGSGRVFGADLLREADAVRRVVGYLGHASGLYPDLTAGENLRFVQRMLGQPSDLAVVRRVLEEVGLAADAETRVRFFSAGMQRRLAIGRILLTGPKLLLLDEPFASVDAAGRELVGRLLEGVRADGGAAVIATHAADRMRPRPDRLLRLVEGRVFDSPPDDEPGGAGGARDRKSGGSPVGLGTDTR